MPSELGPVLHPDDVAEGKISALDGRAEVRDAIDDDGFDPRMFADSLARVQRHTDKQFATYGLTPAEATSLRERFAGWQRQLIAPQSGSPTSEQSTAAAASPHHQQPTRQNPTAHVKPPSPAHHNLAAAPGAAPLPLTAGIPQS